MPKSNEICAQWNNSPLFTTYGNAYETGGLVSIHDGIAVTTSLQVADYFSKRHAHVLDRVQSLLLANRKIGRLYVPATYTDAQGKSRPMYYITKDGFVLLAMGFTGKAAL